MKLVKISPPNSSIEIYKVQQPSKAYKKMFPKRFTYSLLLGGKIHTGNENILPLFVTFSECIGYIFTTKDIVLSNCHKYENSFGNTFPVNLNQYFISNSGDYDLIFEITPTQSSSPKFNESVIIRMNSEELMKSKDVATDTLKIVTEQFKEKISIEEFVLKIINTCPLNFLGYPIDYPKCINNNIINSKIKSKNLFVAYDFRPTKELTHQEEVDVITKIEDTFEDKSYVVSIQNNFNDLKNRLEIAAKEQHIPYKSTKDTINFKLKDFRKLSFEFEFNDLI